MGKNITFTMKIDASVRDMLKEFCRTRGLVMSAFLEKAIIDEIEKEELKEDLLAIQHYEKFERDTTIPFDKVAEDAARYGTRKKT